MQVEKLEQRGYIKDEEKVRCRGGGRKVVPRELAGTGVGVSASSMRTGPGTQKVGKWRWWHLQDRKQ